MLGRNGACGGTAGIYFNMGINQSLTYLKKALFTGTAMKSADITFVKAGSSPVDYYKIHLENV